MSINAFLSEELKKVQAIIETEIDPDKILVKKGSYELFQYGGKKIRPTFTLLVGKLGDDKYYRDIIKLAASLELIHMATLVHDDIIDDSELRRGHTTVYYASGYNQAVLTGNYLLTVALRLASEVHHLELHRVYAKAIQTIVEGELNQFNQQFDAEITLDDYFEKTYRKTALLIESSVALGALASHLDEGLKAQLMSYAYHIGMSYQIIDDCLDFTGDEAVLGKPKYSDLNNGHFTLPVILLRDNDPEFKEQLTAFANSEIPVDTVIQSILNSTAIEDALAVSTSHVEQAIQATSNVKPEIRQHLVNIAEKLQKRIS